MNDRNDPKADFMQAPEWVRHRKLRDWVAEMARLAKPDRVVWCDGSQAEYDRLCAELVAGGTFVRLDEKLRPGSYLAREQSNGSNPGAGYIRVAIVQDRDTTAEALHRLVAALG